MKQGRGKNRNIFLVGGSNGGKSLILRPLEKLFRCLSNPAMNTFSFSGVAGKQVIFLDDFRFSPAEGKPLSWSQMLLLLGGATVTFSQPRTHFSSDFCLEGSNTIPVFCTGKYVPLYVENGRVDGVESEMMRNRFTVFVFHSQIPSHVLRECPSCPHCFAGFIQSGCPFG